MGCPAAVMTHCQWSMFAFSPSIPPSLPFSLPPLLPLFPPSYTGHSKSTPSKALAVSWKNPAFLAFRPCICYSFCKTLHSSFFPLGMCKGVSIHLLSSPLYTHELGVVNTEHYESDASRQHSIKIRQNWSAWVGTLSTQIQQYVAIDIELWLGWGGTHTPCS